MKKIAIISLALLAVASVMSAKSPKRGVAENQFQMEGQMLPLSPGVTWYYNWGSKPGAGYQNQVMDFTEMEYVPMCWNGVNAAAIREHCSAHPECKYILGFNEPNFNDQAHMTPAEAAAKWPELVSLAKELGLEIVAPALNFSPNAPYQNPSKWMTEFVNLVGADAFDYTAIHCYGGLGVMKDLATEFYEKYGKPVWVTEFCQWPGGAGDVYVAPASQLASLISTVEWLEKTDFIYRYAWFKPIGPCDQQNKPNYGLLVPKNGQGMRELSPQGWAYVYMSEFDTNVWNAPNTVIAASDYITSSGLLLDKGENPDCPRPIEISQFNSNATVDYQFEVPSAGNYVLHLSVSGQGEPARFDPQLSVSLLDKTDGEVVKTLATTEIFSLPGDNAVYKTVEIPLTLEAGRQTLRLADVRSGRPSGIRISTLELTDNSGIEVIEAESNNATEVYYNSLGVRVSTDNLAPGFYATSKGRKIVVR